jgi:hypothetical protein
MGSIENQQAKLAKMQDRQLHDSQAVEEAKRNQIKENTFAKPVTVNDTLKSQIGKK